MNNDLQALPKLRDSISYVYIEHAVIEQEDSSITAFQKDARIPIPISSVTCLMLGPGTKITHAAIKAAAENGCMIVWCGENGMHFYASGMGETRSAVNLLRQAELCVNQETRLEVAKRMYIRRFGSISSPDYTLQQLRGMEGIRVREAYKLASKSTGIPWSARTYKKDDWNAQDPVNLALSQANALLYSVCQAAIISLGYSTGLGFIHTGKQLSFVYDIADLYKAEITIPAAFQSARYPGTDLSAAVRTNCRVYFQQARLLKRIPEDIEWIFNLPGSEQRESLDVGNLWNPEGEIPGGINHYGDNE
ncbi:MAG: type I-E CRISPR-associated endonuclease Cas1 [Clostridia bacterium]|nr:type I-E CRISPR-associated endonuclease Cas1 [Clostridia bacterium]